MIFDKPRDARYACFLLVPPVRKGADVELWELQVYGSPKRSFWDERLYLPEPEKDK